jgi:hypothetical protein
VTSEALPVKAVDLMLRRGRRLGQQRQPFGTEIYLGAGRPVAAAARDTPWKPSQPSTKSTCREVPSAA